MEIILKDNAEKGVYSYVNKEECEERIIYSLTDQDAVDACSNSCPAGMEMPSG